ncbi:MAG: ChaN family lipoprotein [Flavipsychrobacter sp.]|nr:ChaN family lipoprotein [Flavipsychrobacter sp.]
MRILAAIALACLSLYAEAQAPYKIYDVKNKKELTESDDIVKAMSKADILFFGEEHDDSIGHMLEAELLRGLHQAYGENVVLSMEMFEADVQQVVNEYLDGLISEKNFVKEARTWKNYTDYKPLVEYAKNNHITLVAANTPPRYVNAVTRGGLSVLQKFGTDSRHWLPPLPVDTATGKYYEKFLEIMGGHGNMPGMHIYQSQNLWDATMAWNVYQAAKKAGRKVFHLNGRFHSDEKMGIIAQLDKYAAKDSKALRILNISCFYADDFARPDWNKYAPLGDYIIVTQNPEKDKEAKK